jgi:ribonucleotide reductase beta subunit family protein with ferritin-like domain
LEDQHVGGRIILKWILDMIDLAEDRDQWRALVNTVEKFLSSCVTGGFSRRVYLHGI